VRALVTGAAGQLGVELLKTAPPEFEVVGLGHRECDITDRAQLDAAMATYRPDVVINTAAYTGVDAAERARGLAHAVNATGAANVALSAELWGARIIHISTDYVFDGNSREPYRPESQPNPINVYGASKLAGEKEVQRSSSSFLIIRSSWLYASHARNFLRTILSALQAARNLRVVNDQTGVPTAARSLALTIWECAARPELGGIHHWVDDGTASWYDFATAIQDIALLQGLVGKRVPIAPISWKEYGAAALRPSYSVLDTSSLSRALGREPRPWESWLAEVLDETR
jgi:dTDP-4-dehydrorhamnose reductase